MKVLITYSRRDRELIHHIYKVLYRAGVAPFMVEFEELGTSGKLTSSYLKQAVYQSEMLIILMTEKTKVPIASRPWVAYIVGLAHSFNRPIWLFESEEAPLKNVNIPHVDYYFIYSESLREDWGRIEKEFYNLVKTRNLPRASIVIGTYVGALLGAGALTPLINLITVSQNQIKRVAPKPPPGIYSKIKTLCTQCRTSYVIFARNKKLIDGFLCPVCRTELRLFSP